MSRVSQSRCAGVASNHADRLANQIGIEMAGAIPGFVTRFDVPDLLTSSRRAGF